MCDNLPKKISFGGCDTELAFFSAQEEGTQSRVQTAEWAVSEGSKVCSGETPKEKKVAVEHMRVFDGKEAEQRLFRRKKPEENQRNEIICAEERELEEDEEEDENGECTLSDSPFKYSRSNKSVDNSKSIRNLERSRRASNTDELAINAAAPSDAPTPTPIY